MPPIIERALSYGRALTKEVGVAKGWRGAAAVIEALARPRLSRGDMAPVDIPMKVLGGGALRVRPGTSDLHNASDYYRLHLYMPPAPVADGDLRQICELGSNMGAALTALAVRYPNARLVGAEADTDSATLARRNLDPYGSRCTVVEAGIWDEDTELVVERHTSYGEHGFSVRERRDSDPAEMPSIAALTIDTLLARHMPEGDVDYMHVSIEGTEPRVFSKGGEWPSRVRSLRVETHPILGYTAADCIGELQKLGYRAWADPDLPTKWVHAVRA